MVGRAKARVLWRQKHILFLILVSLTTACGGAPLTPADIEGSGPERGERLFALNPLGAAPGCLTCHSLEADVVLVGPSLAAMAAAAAEQATGMTPAAYVTESILEPDAVLAPDFNPGAMPRYGEILSEADIADLVAYILSN